MMPFSPRLKRVFAYAERRQTQGVSCIDLLAGIMALKNGPAYKLLKKCGFEETLLHSELSTPRTATGETAQYQPCALTALSGAIAEAFRTSQEVIGVEHMLAGILDAPSPEVTHLFTKKGVIPERMLSELRKQCDPK